MKIPKNATDFELWQYRLIKTFWESDLVEISKKHPALTRRKKQWSDHELSSALVNRFKNYGRRTKLEDNGSEIYSRSAYLDDLFALCSATGTTPNDVLLHTFCSKTQTIYDIWIFLKQTNPNNTFLSQIRMPYEYLSIKLPQNNNFLHKLIEVVKSKFNLVFKYDDPKRLDKITQNNNNSHSPTPKLQFDIADLDFDYEIIDVLKNYLGQSKLISERNLSECSYFEDSLLPKWEFFNEFAFDKPCYEKWCLERNFAMSFSLFILYATFSFFKPMYDEDENDSMPADEYMKHLENKKNKHIKTFVLELLRNSFCFIDDNTFIACNGKVLSTSDIDDVNEYCNAEEQAPHSKGSINDKINFDSRNSFYKQSTVQENR